MQALLNVGMFTSLGRKPSSEDLKAGQPKAVNICGPGVAVLRLPNLGSHVNGRSLLSGVKMGTLISALG